MTDLDKKIKEVLMKSLNADSKSEKEIATLAKNVISYVKRIEEQNKRDIAKLTELITGHKTKMSNDSELSKADVKATVKTELGKLLGAFDAKSKDIDTKVSLLKDGKDADEALMVERVIDKMKADIKIPTTEDLLNNIPELGLRIRDSLELLEGKDRLDCKVLVDCDDLTEVLVWAKSMMSNSMAGGLRPSPTGVETPAGTINGVNKAFVVTFVPQWITVNGQNMYDGNGYALSSSSGVLTITLENAPEVTDIIRSHY